MTFSDDPYTAHEIATHAKHTHLDHSDCRLCDDQMTEQLRGSQGIYG